MLMMISLSMTLLLVEILYAVLTKEIGKDLVNYTFIDHTKANTSSLKSVSILSLYTDLYSNKATKSKKRKKKNQDSLFKAFVFRDRFSQKDRRYTTSA